MIALRYSATHKSLCEEYLPRGCFAGILDSGCELLLGVIPGPNCSSSAYLQVELWDLGQLLSQNPAPAESKNRLELPSLSLSISARSLTQQLAHLMTPRRLISSMWLVEL